MHWLTRIDAALELVERTLLVLLFSSLILLIGFNIFTRNILNYSFQIILEAAPGVVLWMALLGSTLALKQQKHIKLELLLRYLGRPFRSFARIFSGLIGLSIMGLLFVASIEFVINEIEIFGPAGWVSVVFPIFFLLAAFRYALQMANRRSSAGDGGRVE